MKYSGIEAHLRAELDRAEMELASARTKCSELCLGGAITPQEAKLLKADARKRYAEALARFSAFVFRQ
jgi:hypothetical protein